MYVKNRDDMYSIKKDFISLFAKAYVFIQRLSIILSCLQLNLILINIIIFHCYQHRCAAQSNKFVLLYTCMCKMSCGINIILFNFILIL